VAADDAKRDIKKMASVAKGLMVVMVARENESVRNWRAMMGAILAF